MERRIRSALKSAFGFANDHDAALTNLGGHASLRIYWRIDAPTPLFGDEKTLIAMVLPEDFDLSQSDEATSGETPDELPFIAVQRLLKTWDIRVPEIVFADLSLGVLLLEDLGDTMFENVVLERPKDREALYRDAIDLLCDVQRHANAETDKTCVCWSRSFDRDLLRWELDHYIEWGVDALDKSTGLTGESIDVAFETLLDELVQIPTTLSLRDYQSRNIMQKKSEWVVIDFQDALIGPYVYDLVALLRDSYIALDPEMVDRLVDYYVEKGSYDRTATHRAFHLQTIQRKLKDTGRFIYIDQVKKNPDFLPYYEPSLDYVRNAIAKLTDYDTPVWRAITLQ